MFVINQLVVWCCSRTMHQLENNNIEHDFVTFVPRNMIWDWLNFSLQCSTYLNWEWKVFLLSKQSLSLKPNHVWTLGPGHWAWLLMHLIAAQGHSFCFLLYGRREWKQVSELHLQYCARQEAQDVWCRWACLVRFTLESIPRRDVEISELH